ncbi:NifU family domain-containing protein [Besnoitia besnoiti]|uniref:NifU family domain-containing protein n=1 Tax=Besnoitia besnoiti TaxID=94643 RepID=A0A2A9M727_BESBE|nr:NifU family domain-containing protein [Besnoitia besnoiti]PFH33795.1 NifU family domain-containing protein [Besnoitia besnoiti]
MAHSRRFLALFLFFSLLQLSPRLPAAPFLRWLSHLLGFRFAQSALALHLAHGGPSQHLLSSPSLPSSFPSSFSSTFASVPLAVRSVSEPTGHSEAARGRHEVAWGAARERGCVRSDGRRTPSSRRAEACGSTLTYASPESEDATLRTSRGDASETWRRRERERAKDRLHTSPNAAVGFLSAAAGPHTLQPFFLSASSSRIFSSSCLRAAHAVSAAARVAPSAAPCGTLRTLAASRVSSSFPVSSCGLSVSSRFSVLPASPAAARSPLAAAGSAAGAKSPVEPLPQSLASSASVGLNSTMVEQVLESVRPYLRSHGGDVKLVALDSENKVAHLAFKGACSGCPSSQQTLYEGLQGALREVWPDLTVEEAPVDEAWGDEAEPLTVASVEDALKGIRPAIEKLRATLEVLDVSPSGDISLRYQGPNVQTIRLGVEMELRDKLPPDLLGSIDFAAEDKPSQALTAASDKTATATAEAESAARGEQTPPPPAGAQAGEVQARPPQFEGGLTDDDEEYEGLEPEPA